VQKPALILNRGWLVIGTTTVRQALVLLVRGAARVINPSDYEVFELDDWLMRSMERSEELARERFVKTPHFLVEKPEVMLLSRYSKIPRLEVAFSRRNLFRRDGHACQYCGRQAPPSEMSIDHVVPRCKGGKTSWENCVLSCVRCNSRKADRLPRDVGLRLRAKPRRPTWSPLLESLPTARPESWARFLRGAAS
jgi:5-methylcytosine-specific restriction endonuclease McrA